jgi:hypothetical protein
MVVNFTCWAPFGLIQFYFLFSGRELAGIGGRNGGGLYGYGGNALVYGKKVSPLNTLVKSGHPMESPKGRPSYC